VSVIFAGFLFALGFFLFFIILENLGDILRISLLGILAVTAIGVLAWIGTEAWDAVEERRIAGTPARVLPIPTEERGKRFNSWMFFPDESTSIRLYDKPVESGYEYVVEMEKGKLVQGKKGIWFMASDRKGFCLDDRCYPANSAHHILSSNTPLW